MPKAWFSLKMQSRISITVWSRKGRIEYMSPPTILSPRPSWRHKLHKSDTNPSSALLTFEEDHHDDDRISLLIDILENEQGFAGEVFWSWDIHLWRVTTYPCRPKITILSQLRSCQEPNITCRPERDPPPNIKVFFPVFTSLPIIQYPAAEPFPVVT